jgi:prepilin-type N-terminal cleavage/methylation domain-containing protein/prepilin-type processing-associated H-X9-DG protein
MPQVKRGFTLIEMLVVIAIIGVLVALLVPTFGKVREHGNRIKCASNLRQLHTAVANYAGEGLHYPVPVSWQWDVGVENSPIIRGWIHWVGDDEDDDERRYYFEDPDDDGKAATNIKRGQLWKYMRNQIKVYICPSHLHKNPDVVRSYGMSGQMYGDTEDVRTYGKNFLASGMYRSEVMLFAEITEERLQDEVNGSYYFSTNAANDQLEHRHGGKANVVYCDGHLERQ